MKTAAAFWSENNAQHITTLLKSNVGSTAVLNDFFKERLKDYYERFININKGFKTAAPNMAQYQEFLRTNAGFVNLLERIKYEAFSGYPILQQSVFHYIYEARYINAVFGTKNATGGPIITVHFLPFLNNTLACLYNQMYFWGIIGAMHPSLIMGNNAFYNAINGYAKEFLTEVCNNFNSLNYRLSSLKKPLKKAALAYIFKDFSAVNNEYLDFLGSVKAANPKIFLSSFATRLPTSFYAAIDHQIAEHTLVAEINKNIEKLIF